jgi:hypothetical protein
MKPACAVLQTATTHVPLQTSASPDHLKATMRAMPWCTVGSPKKTATTGCAVSHLRHSTPCQQQLCRTCKLQKVEKTRVSTGLPVLSRAPSGTASTTGGSGSANVPCRPHQAAAASTWTLSRKSQQGRGILSAAPGLPEVSGCGKSGYGNSSARKVAIKSFPV